MSGGRELWSDALRAQIEGVVAGVQAHVEAIAERDARDREALRAERDAALRELAELRAAHEALRRHCEQVSAERDRASGEAREAREALAELDARQREMSAQLSEARAAADALEGEFEGERDFVSALSVEAATALREAIERTSGARIDASPAGLAALKSRGLDATLAAGLRERGRAALRSPVEGGEREALERAAQAAGCALAWVEPGARFDAGAMDKAGERSEPSEEGLVLACVAPGLLAASGGGSLVHPRVVVATA